MTALDVTVYPQGDQPEEHLGVLFAKHSISTAMRLHLCAMGLKTMELWSNLAADPMAAIPALEQVCPAMPWSTTAHIKQMEQVRLRAIFSAAITLSKGRLDRLQKIEEDPSKLPAIPEGERQAMRNKWELEHPDTPLEAFSEPHPRFVDRMRRDYLLTGRVPIYRVEEIRVMSDVVTQTTGFTKNVDHILSQAWVDDNAVVDSEHNAMERILAFYIAVAFLGIMPMTMTTSLLFLRDLKLWSRRNQGLDMIIKVDFLFRQAIDEHCRDHSLDKFPQAFDSVYKHRKDVWNTAITEVRCDRMDRRSSARLVGSSPGAASSTMPPALTPESRKQRKRRLAEERAFDSRRADPGAGAGSPRVDKGKSKGKGKGDKGGKGAKGVKQPRVGDARPAAARVPATEWGSICMKASQTPARDGVSCCRFYNSSGGCARGDTCTFLHECFDCPGAKHAWAVKHSDRL